MPHYNHTGRGRGGRGDRKGRGGRGSQRHSGTDGNNISHHFKPKDTEDNSKKRSSDERSPREGDAKRYFFTAQSSTIGKPGTNDTDDDLLKQAELAGVKLQQQVQKDRKAKEQKRHNRENERQQYLQQKKLERLEKVEKRLKELEVQDTDTSHKGEVQEDGNREPKKWYEQDIEEDENEPDNAYVESKTSTDDDEGIISLQSEVKKGDSDLSYDATTDEDDLFDERPDVLSRKLDSRDEDDTSVASITNNHEPKEMNNLTPIVEVNQQQPEATNAMEKDKDGTNPLTATGATSDQQVKVQSVTVENQGTVQCDEIAVEPSKDEGNSPVDAEATSSNNDSTTVIDTDEKSDQRQQPEQQRQDQPMELDASAGKISSVVSIPEEENNNDTGKGSNTTTAISTAKLNNKFKKVNPHSKNRRKKADGRREGNSKTPERNNKKAYEHQYKTRVTWKLKVKASDNPLQAVKELCQEFLREQAQIDDKITLLHWNSKGTTAPITSKDAMPDTITGTHKFLHKLFLPKPGVESIIYPQVHIGHDIDYETLREEITSWANNFGHGMFYNMLQEEDGTEIGWLLYSTREMDAGALADEIQETIGIPVGLRFKAINTGVKKVKTENMVRAMVVEVSAKQKWECQSKLMKLYSRAIKSPEDYPNGIRLRFVKLKKSGVNSVEKGKMEKLRQRQKDFLQTITSTDTNEILQLDYSKTAGVIPTVRQMIMSIRSRQKGYPLFHCVDLDWKEEGFIFQFSNKLAEEAETTIHTLLPLLQHMYPHAEVHSNFSKSCARRCKDMIWDNDKNMIIDKNEGPETLEIQEEENLVGFEFSEEAVENLQRPLNTPKTFAPQDDDSVSTLRSHDRTTKTMKSNTTTGTQPNTDGTITTKSNTSTQVITVEDDKSTASNSTYLTMESFNVLDNRITGLTSQLVAETNRNKQQFEAIMKALSQITTTFRQNDQSAETQQGNTGDDKNSSGAGS